MKGQGQTQELVAEVLLEIDQHPSEDVAREIALAEMREGDDQDDQEGRDHNVLEAFPGALTEELAIDGSRIFSGEGRVARVLACRTRFVRRLGSREPVPNPTELPFGLGLVATLEHDVIEERFGEIRPARASPGVGQGAEHRDQQNRDVGTQVAGEPPARLPGTLGIDAIPRVVVRPATHSPRG